MRVVLRRACVGRLVERPPGAMPRVGASVPCTPGVLGGVQLLRRSHLSQALKRLIFYPHLWPMTPSTTAAPSADPPGAARKALLGGCDLRRRLWTTVITVPLETSTCRLRACGCSRHPTGAARGTGSTRVCLRRRWASCCSFWPAFCAGSSTPLRALREGAQLLRRKINHPPRCSAAPRPARPAPPRDRPRACPRARPRPALAVARQRLQLRHQARRHAERRQLGGRLQRGARARGDALGRIAAGRRQQQPAPGGGGDVVLVQPEPVGAQGDQTPVRRPRAGPASMPRPGSRERAGARSARASPRAGSARSRRRGRPGRTPSCAPRPPSASPRGRASGSRAGRTPRGARSSTLRIAPVIARRLSVSTLILRTPCWMPSWISSTGTPQVCFILPPYWLMIVLQLLAAPTRSRASRGGVSGSRLWISSIRSIASTSPSGLRVNL